MNFLIFKINQISNIVYQIQYNYTIVRQFFSNFIFALRHQNGNLSAISDIFVNPTKKSATFKPLTYTSSRRCRYVEVYNLLNRVIMCVNEFSLHVLVSEQFQQHFIEVIYSGYAESSAVQKRVVEKLFYRHWKMLSAVPKQKPHIHINFKSSKCFQSLV